MLTDLKVFPIVHVGNAFPDEFAVIHYAHDVTYLVEIVFSLEDLSALLVLVSSSLPLLKHLDAALLGLLHLEPLP